MNYLPLACCLLMSSCEIANLDISTGDVTDILPTSVNISGYLFSAGDGIKKYGHCYSKTPGPTIYDQKTESVSTIGEGIFTSFIQGLDPGMKYYSRAYVNLDKKTFYGNEVSFITAGDTPPGITTTAVSEITATSALSGGTIINNGGIPVTLRGVCWSTSLNPTVEDNKTTDESGPGTFSSIVTGLTGSTTYFIRAYATRPIGIVYGNEFSFTTTP